MSGKATPAIGQQLPSHEIFLAPAVTWWQMSRRVNPLVGYALRISSTMQDKQRVRKSHVGSFLNCIYEEPKKMAKQHRVIGDDTFAAGYSDGKKPRRRTRKNALGNQRSPALLVCHVLTVKRRIIAVKASITIFAAFFTAPSRRNEAHVGFQWQRASGPHIQPKSATRSIFHVLPMLRPRLPRTFSFRLMTKVQIGDINIADSRWHGQEKWLYELLFFR